MTEVIAGIVSSIFGGFAGWLTSWLQTNRQERIATSAGIGLIRFYLRQLEIKMSIVRYFPKLHFIGLNNAIPRLAEAALSNDGSRILGPEVRELVYLAIQECEQAVDFLTFDDERLGKGGTPETEYRMAAGRRALRAIYRARKAVADEAPVAWPSDPLGLHNWHPGTEIVRDVDMLDS